MNQKSTETNPNLPNLIPSIGFSLAKPNLEPPKSLPKEPLLGPNEGIQKRNQVGGKHRRTEQQVATVIGPAIDEHHHQDSWS